MEVYETIQRCQTYEELGFIIDNVELNADQSEFALNRLYELTLCNGDQDVQSQPCGAIV